MQENSFVKERLKVLENEITQAAIYKDNYQDNMLRNFCLLLNSKKKKISELEYEMDEIRNKKSSETIKNEVFVSNVSKNSDNKSSSLSRKRGIKSRSTHDIEENDKLISSSNKIDIISDGT